MKIPFPIIALLGLCIGILYAMIRDLDPHYRFEFGAPLAVQASLVALLIAAACGFGAAIRINLVQPRSE